MKIDVKRLTNHKQESGQSDKTLPDYFYFLPDWPYICTCSYTQCTHSTLRSLKFIISYLTYFFVIDECCDWADIIICLPGYYYYYIMLLTEYKLLTKAKINNNNNLVVFLVLINQIQSVQW